MASKSVFCIATSIEQADRIVDRLRESNFPNTAISALFADKSATQVWAVLLDEGIYLGSVSTFYRVLRAAGQVKERRAQATHPARVRPELLADAPDQVWTWDI